MKKHNRKLLTLTLACALVFTNFTDMPAASAAKKKLHLSKTRLTLQTGQKKTLTVKNTKKKVHWYSSRKAVAAVNRKGVVTAKKAGKARITAKIGKKKLICKVTVKAKKVSAATPVPAETPSESENQKRVPQITCKTTEVNALSHTSTLRFQIENGTFKTNVKTLSVRCADAFENMKASLKNVTEDSLTLQLDGTTSDDADKQYWGKLSFSYSDIVTDADTGNNSSYSCDISVIHPSIYADTENASFSDGTLSLPLSISGMNFPETTSLSSFTLKDADSVSLERIKISSTDSSTDEQTSKEEAATTDNTGISQLSLIFTTSCDTITEAVKVLNEASLIYDEAGYHFETRMIYHAPSFDNQIWMEADEEENYHLAGKLFASGVGECTLTKEDVTITRENMTVTNGTTPDLTIDTLTYNKEMGCYDLTLSSSSVVDPDSLASLDATFVINGTKVKNIYGETDATEYTTALYLIAAGNDGITDFWDEYGDTIKGYIGNAASVIKIGYSVLQMAGVLESSESRERATYQLLQETNLQIQQILTLLNQMTIRDQQTAIRDQYNQAKNCWQSFYQKAKDLQTLTNTYLSQKKTKIYELLRSSNGITVYLDEDGNVTVPKLDLQGNYSSTTAYDEKGLLDSPQTYAVSSLQTEDGTTIAMLLRQNLMWYSDAFANNAMNTVKNTLIRTYGKTIGEQIYDSVIAQSSYRNSFEFETMNKTGYVEKFNQIFEELTTNDCTGKKPIEYFDTIMSLQYNFDEETHDQKDSIRLYINALFATTNLISCEIENNLGIADLVTHKKVITEVSNYMEHNTGYLDDSTEDDVLYSFVLNAKFDLKQIVCREHRSTRFGMHYFYMDNWACVMLFYVGRHGDFDWYYDDEYGIASDVNNGQALLSINDFQSAELQRRSIQNGYKDIYANMAHYLPSSASLLANRTGLMTSDLTCDSHNDTGVTNNSNVQCIHAEGGNWYYLQWCNHSNWDTVMNIRANTLNYANTKADNSIAIVVVGHEKKGKKYMFRNDTFVKPLFYLRRV